MTDQPQKVAIIIGASGGIGKAVALRLAQDGFAIVGHYAGNAANVDEVLAAIKAPGGRAIGVKADVAAEADVVALFNTTLDTFGRIDVVVHSAGIMPMGSIADGDLTTFDKVIATNLRGTFIVLSQAARHVAEGGRIIAFSSSVLTKSFPNYGAYVASKGGVEGLVRVLANELRGRNITVNAVAPGPTGTELFLKGKSNGLIDSLAKMAPLERIGTPQDIAGTVSFLAGADGAWVNAQVIRSNGGFA
ncbi:short-chain dehydrogenase [Labrys miyagiensis]|uniref:Short-chain dehydrogenase n=1 Tax=Labrys miyagiensis TaxID=346912 RepID=A0ABQ6CPS1_9HYPH|nr:SDR family oxidoreductase [Labrys miyagiensis]GLS22361.1 short-chain dehydrogenase [Labrys miyagiensis]